MPKQSRRSKAKFQKARNRQQVTPVNRVDTVNKAAIDTRVAKSAASVAQAALSSDKYKYILSDLRNIGIISGALISILIVLTFVLQ